MIRRCRSVTRSVPQFEDVFRVDSSDGLGQAGAGNVFVSSYNNWLVYCWLSDYTNYR